MFPMFLVRIVNRFMAWHFSRRRAPLPTYTVSIDRAIMMFTEGPNDG